MNIAVYCGSDFGNQDVYKRAAPSLGNGSEKTIIHWCMAEENPG